MNKRALEYAKQVGIQLKDIPTSTVILPYSFLSFDNLTNALFSVAQQVVTGKPFSHSAFSVPLAGSVAVWGADLTVDMQSFDKFGGEDFIVFTPAVWAFTDLQLQQVFWEAFVEFGGMTYAFLETPMFCWRFVAARVFRINTDKWHNWFPGHVICSQLNYAILLKMARFQPGIQPVLDQYVSTLYDSGQQFECMVQLVKLGLFTITNKRWSF
jgi:hypothetical protein